MVLGACTSDAGGMCRGCRGRVPEMPGRVLGMQGACARCRGHVTQVPCLPSYLLC